MALLRHLASNTTHVLRALHLVGRARRHDLWLTNPRASNTHAELCWTGSAWEVHDLDSSNGTFVARRRLNAGERVKLERGVEIAFGDLEDPFELIRDDAPTVMATSVGGEQRIADKRTLALPEPDTIEVEVFYVDQESRWVAQSREDKPRFEVFDGDWLPAGGDMWQLHLPQVGGDTLRRPTFMLYTLSMNIIVNGDHINIEIQHGGQKKTFPHRAHHELIYVLGDARLRHQREGVLPESEHGWVETNPLLDMLGRGRSDPNWIHVATYRTRAMFDKAEVIGGSDVIERRPGETRLGIRNISIVMV